MTRRPRVAFVGLGNMGWPMAQNIVGAGYPLHVLDADSAKAERFERDCGGNAVGGAAAVGREADVVITMLPTGRDVRDLVLGSPGESSAALVASLRRGAVIVDMSSSDPIGTRELGAELRSRGIALIDAPVSGLVTRAQSGTLTIMIGADDEQALEMATPILECLGEQLIRVGSLGCGHAMKALNNIVGATAFTATAEALIIGTRFGLDPKIMVDVLNISTGRNFHTDMTFPLHVLPRQFATGFTLGLLTKDVATAADLSGAVDAKTPLLDLVSRLWAEGRDEVGAGEDNSAIIKRWERLNDTTVAPADPPPAAPAPPGAGTAGTD